MAGQKIVTAAYQQIAIDIARGIVNGKYSTGERLSGRSTLAGYYGVSPETIRRAAYILKDVGIVDISKGSGIEVVSKEKALEFEERFKNAENLNELKEEIKQLMENQKLHQIEIQQKLSRFISMTEKYSDVNPFAPFSLRITKDMTNVGKSSSEVNFWQNTGATIIAIKRGNETIISPGPYADFKENDILYYVGHESCAQRVENLFGL